MNGSELTEHDISTKSKLPFKVEYKSDPSYEYVIDEPDSTLIVPIKKLSRPVGREDMENMKVVTKLFTGKENAGLTIPAFGGITLTKDEGNYNVFYIEWKVQGKYIYAIGYSYHLLIKKIRRGINLNDLSKLAASVELGSSKSEVYYSFQTIGMMGAPLGKYLEPMVNQKFDIEGLNLMQESIKGVHALMFDEKIQDKIKYKPQLIEILDEQTVRGSYGKMF